MHLGFARLTGEIVTGTALVDPHVSLSSAGRQRLLEEEAQHLPGGVGSSGIGVGARGTPARPGMAGSVDDPLLQDRPPARILLHGATIGMPAGDPPVLHTELHLRGPGLLRAGDDGVALA